MAEEGKPRAIIAKLRYFQVKELVLRLSPEKATDLMSATMKKRQAVQDIKEKRRARKT